MGWWGVKSTENDGTADWWAEVMSAANKVARKAFKEAQRRGGGVYAGDLYAAIGVVIYMADAGIPISSEVYDDAVAALDVIEGDAEFAKSWRSPAAFKRAFAETAKQLRGLKSKRGAAIGLAGGRMPAVL